jgi:Fic family protein
VLRFGSGVAAYWAFVPNPLPPVLLSDAELIRVLAEASYALGELAALGRLLPNPHLLIDPFIRREAVLSSRIEGTQASLADVYAYEAGQLVLPGFPAVAHVADVREVVNYVSAVEYGLERLNTLPVSLRLVRELHERLMRGVRGEHMTPGEFRRSQNWIGPPGCSLNDATYVPPPVPEMDAALAAFEKYLHADADLNAPLVRLAMIHYQFEAIHPFLDGNGRIGRLLIILLLISWNLLSLPLLYLSAYFERNRSEYYERLLAVTQQGAWRPWIVYFLRGVTEQSRDAAGRAKRLQDLQAGWRGRLIAQRAPARAMNLVDHLFHTPVLTIPRVQKLLGVTYHAAQSNVERLVAAGILRLVGESGQGKMFVADEIMRALSD